MMRPFSCGGCALNALQNSMMLTPCWPSAGPTGGAGFAWPPGIWSLISVRTFFAIKIREGPGRHLDGLAERELDLRARRRTSRRARAQDAIDLGLRERHGLR